MTFKNQFFLPAIMLVLSLCSGVRAASVQPPNYSAAPILPMITPQDLGNWLSKVDTLPTEPFFNAPIVSSGALMASCSNPNPPLITLGTTVCYNTDSMTPPDSGLGNITNQNRLTLIQYFALRFSIQTNPLFFQPQFFDPSYIPPAVLAAGSASGPSVLNAYAACIRIRIYDLENKIASMAPSSLNGHFDDPYTSLSKATLLKSIQIGIGSQLASARRLAKLFDYIFPDAYAWQNLLVATGNDSKCGS